MNKKILRVSTDAEKHMAISALKALNLTEEHKKLPYLVTIDQKNASRTDKQRRLQFMWYKELAEQLHSDPAYQEHYHKLIFGVPILRRLYDDYHHLCQVTLDTMCWTDRIAAMKYFAVTRLFGVAENAEYLNDIEHQARENGLTLTHPEDLYWDAIMRRGDK